MPMPAPTVSVVLPTYQRDDAIFRRAVLSVLCQSYSDFELIVVDDGSKSPPEALLAEFGDPRIRLIAHPKNRGPAAARNTGISAALGRYIAFQDSDDEWGADKLALQMAALEGKGANVISVGVVLRRYEETLRRWPLSTQPPTQAGEYPLWTFAYLQALLVPKDLLDLIGGIDEQMQLWEDWDLILRLAPLAELVVQNNAYVISSRMDDSITTTNHGDLRQAQWAALMKQKRFALERPIQFASFQYMVARRELERGSARQASRYFLAGTRLNPRTWKSWLFLLIAWSKAFLKRS